MRVVVAPPPIFDEIDALFCIRGLPVIFAWGDTIYNPEGVTISPELRAHEAIHGKRQAGNPGHWWRRYLDDAEFRLAEEIPAHRTEYFRFCARHTNRKRRGAYLDHVSQRLSGPLYGSLLTPERARDALLRPN